MKALRKIRKDYWLLVRKNYKTIKHNNTALSSPEPELNLELKIKSPKVEKPSTLKGYIIMIKSWHRLNKYRRQLRRKIRYEQGL